MNPLSDKILVKIFGTLAEKKKQTKQLTKKQFYNSKRNFNIRHKAVLDYQTPRVTSSAHSSRVSRACGEVGGDLK